MRTATCVMLVTSQGRHLSEQIHSSLLLLYMCILSSGVVYHLTTWCTKRCKRSGQVCNNVTEGGCNL